MQRFLKAKRCFSCVHDLEFQDQFGTECHSEDRAKVGRTPFLRGLIVFDEHTDGHCVTSLYDRFKLPSCCPRESVHWRIGVVCFAGKPGKADRYAAANGTAVVPLRLRADEEDFFCVRRLPGRHVSAVQIQLTLCRPRSDFHLGKSTTTRDDFDDLGDSEPLIQLCNFESLFHAMTSA